jgi:hypothetical protein
MRSHFPFHSPAQNRRQLTVFMKHYCIYNFSLISTQIIPAYLDALPYLILHYIIWHLDAPCYLSKFTLNCSILFYSILRVDAFWRLLFTLPYFTPLFSTHYEG